MPELHFKSTTITIKFSLQSCDLEHTHLCSCTCTIGPVDIFSLGRVFYLKIIIFYIISKINFFACFTDIVMYLTMLDNDDMFNATCKNYCVACCIVSTSFNYNPFYHLSQVFEGTSKIKCISFIMAIYPISKLYFFFC